MQRALTICLFALCLASCGAWTAMRRPHWRVLRLLTATAVAFVLEYIVVCAALFLLDVFSICGALGAQLAINAALLVPDALRVRAGQALPGVELDLRGHLVPLALAALALLMSSGHFGFFGMGQDEGVYQTKAIDLMNGKTAQIYRFEELDGLDAAEERDRFLYGTREWLIGLYSVRTHWTRDYVLALPPLVNRVATPEAGDGDAVYHGIPTYPAVLALSGVIGGGYGRMMDAQTVGFVLCVLLLWFVAENLGLKKTTSAALCLVFVISPQVVWLSKSALTEMLHALIICAFMYLITEPEHTGRRWWSAFAVTAFAVFHVSVYVMVPMFVGIYWLLYRTTGDRQYIRGAVCALLSFLAGFAFMAIVSPSYVTENLFPVSHGPITPFNGWQALMAAGLLGLALTAVVAVVPQPAKRASVRYRSRRLNAAFRVLIVLLPCVSLFRTVLAMKDLGIEQAISQSGLYVFMWITGIVAIPAGTVYLYRKGVRVLRQAPVAAIACMFVYSVLLMASFMKPRITYCYYYSRYLGPYIPVACVMAGIALDGLSARALCACTAAGVLALAPFDGLLLTQDDDTYCSFDTLERVLDAVSSENAAVIFPRNGYEPYRMFFLPARAVGCDCYLQDIEDKAEAQFYRLAGQYETLYTISDSYSTAVVEGEEILRLQDATSMDDNVSSRLPLCPFPRAFQRGGKTFTVCRWEGRSDAYPAEQLYTTGSFEGDRIRLDAGQLQYGPYVSLYAGTWQVRVEGQGLDRAAFIATADKGETSIPVEALSSEDGSATYTVTLAKAMQDVEFLVRNDGGEPIFVDRIQLEDLRHIQ